MKTCSYYVNFVTKDIKLFFFVFGWQAKQTEKLVEANNNLVNKFAPLPGSWTCDTCLVSNKATDTKCVACQSSKPSTGKPATKKPAPLSNDLLQKFAPPAGSWSCDTCMLSNDASKTKCVACETPKPGAKATVPSSKPVFNSDSDLMKKFAPPTDAWSCDVCLVQNKSTDTICVACQSPKPGAANTAKTNVAPSFGISTNAVSDNSLAAKFAPAAGSWTCDSCMVNNKGEDSSCIACQTPKPGAEPAAKITSKGFKLPGVQTLSSSPFKFGVSNSSGANFSSGSSINFGVDTKSTDESNSSVVTFGTSTADENNKSGSNQAESSGKLPATFRFGASSQPSDSGTGETKTNAALPYGSPAVNHTGKDESATGPPKFSFGVSSSSDKDEASTGGFMFGASQTSVDKGINSFVVLLSSLAFK